MNSKYTAWIMIALIALLLFNLGWRFVYSERSEEFLSLADVGQPYIYHENAEFTSMISEIAANDNYVYMLYEEQLAVKVYDLIGNYVCSIFVKDETHFLNPARCHIYAYDDSFFIECFDAAYEFHNTDFVQYYSEKAARPLIVKLNSNRPVMGNIAYSGDGTEYRLRGTSVIYRSSNNSEQVFLYRSPWIFCYSFKFTWIISILCIGGILVCTAHLRR